MFRQVVLALGLLHPMPSQADSTEHIATLSANVRQLQEMVAAMTEEREQLRRRLAELEQMEALADQQSNLVSTRQSCDRVGR